MLYESVISITNTLQKDLLSEFVMSAPEKDKFIPIKRKVS